MAGAGADRSSDLQTLAEQRFGELSEAERKLVRAAPRGEGANCGPDATPPAGAENDPANAISWEPGRAIRAALLEWLCTDRAAVEKVHRAGIKVHAARIEGRLNLPFVTVSFPSFSRVAAGPTAST